MLRVFPVDPYPAAYRACVDQSIIEVKESYKPPLQAYSVDSSQYDTVFLGTPNWCGTFAPPLLTFMSSHDFTGKIILPFCTHGGAGQRNFTAHMKEHFPENDLRETLVLYEDGGFNAAYFVYDWLNELISLDK